MPTVGQLVPQCVLQYLPNGADLWESLGVVHLHHQVVSRYVRCPGIQGRLNEWYNISVRQLMQ